MDVQRLYPQYRAISDRRKQTVPVSFERRSGEERRNQDRVKLDTNLTRDIFEIKSKVSQLQKPESSNVTRVANIQNTEKAASHTIKVDEFVKTTNSIEKNKMQPVKSSEDARTRVAAGLLTGALAGVIATAFMGPVAGGVAVGLGVYFGGKLLKEVISSHMKNK